MGPRSVAEAENPSLLPAPCLNDAKAEGEEGRTRFERCVSIDGRMIF